MISVIILTKNNSYNILDVPGNGRLVIREDHLICGITQNGVSMVPYGNVLVPFEVFIWDNTLSLEMIPNHIFQSSGRVLDFSNIELLQAQQTFHPGNSGSEVDYEPISYIQDGFPINYNVVLDGVTFDDYKKANDIWRYGINGTLSGTNDNRDAQVNAIALQANGMQKISLCKEGKGVWKSWSTLQGLKGIYGLTGITRIESYGLNSPTLETLVCPNANYWAESAIGGGNSVPGLKLVDVPKLTQFGNDPATVGALYGDFSYGTKVPLGVHFRVNRAMETINNGFPDADLQAVLDNRQATVEYVD